METLIAQESVHEAESWKAATITSPPLRRPAEKLTFEQASKLAAGRSFELIDGRVVFKMPDNKHAHAQTILGYELVAYLKGHPLGRVFTEFTFRLWPDNPYESRIPDLSVILNEHFKDERYGSRAPDLAVEIISRDDVWSALFEKADLYFEKGSRVVWFVDPYREVVLVVTPNDQQWVKDTLTCPELLPGFAVKLREIFNWPEASKRE